MTNTEGKPIIGIVSKHLSIDRVRGRTYVRDEMERAVFDNGGIAIGLLPAEREIEFCGDDWQDDLTPHEKTDLVREIKLCDGIILQGGLDSDNYESIVAKYCYDNDIPILGICAGQNNVVRALGGTTYNIPNPEKHGVSLDKYVHGIKINKKSKFYDIVKTTEMMVNSRHRKTIKNCPKLRKVAFCDDGYPDVVEAQNKKFYMGIRFHPETLYLRDEKMNSIFEEFVRVCGNEK